MDVLEFVKVNKWAITTFIY